MARAGHPAWQEDPAVLEEKLKILQAPLTPAEKDTRNNCVVSLCCKIGLPFAILSQVITEFRRKGKTDLPPPKIPRLVSFAGHILLSVILFKPFCDYTVMAKRLADYTDKKGGPEGIPSFDDARTDSQSSSQHEEFSYPVDLMTNLSEHEGGFSTDFTSTKLELEDDREAPTKPTTTYEDLRARNRKSQSSKYTPPSSTLNYDSEISPRRPVEEPVVKDEPPQFQKPRRVNKYGDEME